MLRRVLNVEVIALFYFIQHGAMKLIRRNLGVIGLNLDFVNVFYYMAPDIN